MQNGVAVALWPCRRCTFGIPKQWRTQQLWWCIDLNVESCCCEASVRIFIFLPFYTRQETARRVWQIGRCFEKVGRRPRIGRRGRNRRRNRTRRRRWGRRGRLPGPFQRRIVGRAGSRLLFQKRRGSETSGHIRRGERYPSIRIQGAKANAGAISGLHCN